MRMEKSTGPSSSHRPHGSPAPPRFSCTYDFFSDAYRHQWQRQSDALTMSNSTACIFFRIRSRCFSAVRMLIFSRDPIVLVDFPLTSRSKTSCSRQALYDAVSRLGWSNCESQPWSPRPIWCGSPPRQRPQAVPFPRELLRPESASRL